MNQALSDESLSTLAQGMNDLGRLPGGQRITKIRWGEPSDFFEAPCRTLALATRANAMDNGTREELITMTQDPKRKPEDPDKADIEDENEAAEREDSVIDEQGKESFPASDPPANY